MKMPYTMDRCSGFSPAYHPATKHLQEREGLTHHRSQELHFHDQITYTATEQGRIKAVGACYISLYSFLKKRRHWPPVLTVSTKHSLFAAH